MQSVPIVCFCLFMVFNATLVMMALIAQVVVNQQPVWPRRPPVSIVTTKVVISNHSQGQVYSIQHYVIKFVCDRSMLCLWGFFPLNKKKNLFFFCLSSSCVLCVECCQCLRPVSCVECCQCLLNAPYVFSSVYKIHTIYIDKLLFLLMIILKIIEQIV